MKLLPVTLQLDKALLPEAARRDFDFWCDRLEPLLTLRRGVEAKLREIAAATGTPYRTVRNKFYAGKSKGITAWIDKRLAGPRYWNSKTSSLAVDVEDQELVKLYCGLNQRSSRAAVKQLRKDWVRRRPCDAIQARVGADEAERIRRLLLKPRPTDARTGLPCGWSTDNLSRYAPSDFELKSVRIGRSAAASERELVYTGRKGLWVGSHYMLDDMWHDFFINSLVERQAGRPLELFSHDLFSARKVRWGFRLRTRSADGKYNQLTEKMTRFILAATLYLDGYSPRGTVIVAEHGTAAVRGKTKKGKDDFENPIVIREGLDKELYEMSGGLITVNRSGMQGAAAHAGQYPGISCGNFRMKASLESANNLTHNVFAQLPGQTGKDVAHRPEELGALLDNNRDLLIASRYLSPEKAALLQYPILEETKFHSVAHELYRAIDEDPEHELDQWLECGHVVTELLIGAQWVAQEEILKTPDQVAVVRHLIETGSLKDRSRKMTRGEVWRAGARDLVRIPGYGVCAILGDDLACPRKVTKNRFEFQDHEVGPGTHRFESIAFTPHGESIQLRDGEVYETFVNPFAPDTMFVRRADGSYIGECRRIETICRADTEAVQRRCGEVAKREKELLAPIVARHMGEAREKARRASTNAAVLSGKALTFAERCKAIEDRQRQKSERGDLTDLVVPAQVETAPAPEPEADDDHDGLAALCTTQNTEPDDEQGI